VVGVVEGDICDMMGLQIVDDVRKTVSKLFGRVDGRLHKSEVRVDGSWSWKVAESDDLGTLLFNNIYLFVKDG